MRRVSRSGRVLLLAFHIGRETIHLEEMLNVKVCSTFFLYQTEEIKEHLETIGFTKEKATERYEYSEMVGCQTKRVYVLVKEVNKIAARDERLSSFF